MKNVVTLLLVSLIVQNALNAQDSIVLKPLKQSDLESVRRVRIAQLTDPFRPTWHLTIAEGFGMPFDPNGAIYKDGIYHLWYLYQVGKVHHWQHLTSKDLFHWRWLPSDLEPNPDDPEIGIFSGNAFTAKDGNVVIAYHGLGSNGNSVAYSNDENLNIWKKPEANPIVKPGWDPHMWLENDAYYQISGGKPVSSGNPNPPFLYKGQSYTEPLNRIGNFMSHDMPGVDEFEDISCPDFFELKDKRVLVCISHQRGARYYIGSWDGKQFKPESHHRMNWRGGSLFAPETLIDDKGRRIMWAWVLDRKSGVSSGTMSMPRVLTLSKDKTTLNIEPPKEIENLRYDPVSLKSFVVEQNQSAILKNVKGRALEIDITIDPKSAKRFGVKVFSSKDAREETLIVIDINKDILQIDMSRSSLDIVSYQEFIMQRDNPGENMKTQDAPFKVRQGEKVHLRIFLDKSILEVFANGKQCITQVVYPTLDDAVNVQVFTEDAPIKIEQVKSWKLFPTMQW